MTTVVQTYFAIIDVCQILSHIIFEFQIKSRKSRFTFIPVYFYTQNRIAQLLFFFSFLSLLLGR